jgi:hypothetical protein
MIGCNTLVKKLLITLVFFILISGIALYAQSYQGIYVDGFDRILGNRVKEDSLLNYCKSHGFNALTTYKTKDVERKFKITNPQKGGKILAAFIKRAKQNYGIRSIAMSSEQFSTFRDIVARYNRTRVDTLERVNAFNFEFEFWHRKSTAADGYYCKKYLQAAGCSCDSSGAFKFYLKQLTSIDSLAQTLGVKSEVYIGKPNEGQALAIAEHVDRILVDVYLKKPENAYERALERMNYFSHAQKQVILIPIWGSTDEFMGEWQRAHSLDDANSLFMEDFNKNKKLANSSVRLAGFQWYKYSTMKK